MVAVDFEGEDGPKFVEQGGVDNGGELAVDSPELLTFGKCSGPKKLAIRDRTDPIRPSLDNSVESE